MTTLQAFILGVLQGVTEFLPVSSSGHLVLVESFFNLQIDPLSMQGFNVLLHAGTLLALLFCYCKQWKRLILSPFTGDNTYRRLFIILVVATIPGAIAGLAFEDTIANKFSSPSVVAVAFLVTALVLIIGERAEQARRIEHLAWTRVLFIGVAQACALVPGLSRSGFTISAARMLRIERRDALDFSFLLAAPIIAGATLVSILGYSRGTVELPGMQIVMVGLVSSFIASMLAIRFLRSFVTRHSLAWFSWYLVAVSVILLAQGL